MLGFCLGLARNVPKKTHCLKPQTSKFVMAKDFGCGCSSHGNLPEKAIYATALLSVAPPHRPDLANKHRNQGHRVPLFLPDELNFVIADGQEEDNIQDLISLTPHR